MFWRFPIVIPKSHQTQVVPEDALSAAIARLDDIAELLCDQGLDDEARSLVTTTSDLAWQLEELAGSDPS
jgi:hypothetical protein